MTLENHRLAATFEMIHMLTHVSRKQGVKSSPAQGAWSKRFRIWFVVLFTKLYLR